MYSKNDAAPRPPMGWNSYDYYNTMVNEEQVKANAGYMAANLKEFGWEYVVIDIQWSDPDAGRLNPDVQYIPFSHFCLDAYSRQIPAPTVFRRAKTGRALSRLLTISTGWGLNLVFTSCGAFPAGLPMNTCGFWEQT